MLCNTAGYHPEPIMPSAADEAILQWCKMESCLWCMPQMRVMCWLCSQDHLDRLAKTFQSLCHQQLKLWFVLFAHFVCLRYRKSSSSSNFFLLLLILEISGHDIPARKAILIFTLGASFLCLTTKDPKMEKFFLCVWVHERMCVRGECGCVCDEWECVVSVHVCVVRACVRVWVCS